jgi:hypothetical protein
MDFSTEIANFKANGLYKYQIDDGGNLLLNSNSENFNQNYISVPLYNDNYNTSKISTFYPIDFVEFVSPEASVPDVSIENLQFQLSHSIENNTSLQKQLNEISDLQLANNSAADVLAAKQTIIKLRILLGQGKHISDFNTTFPYIPIK